jgi:hypothetical protein
MEKGNGLNTQSFSTGGATNEDNHRSYSNYYYLHKDILDKKPILGMDQKCLSCTG